MNLDHCKHCVHLDPEHTAYDPDLVHTGPCPRCQARAQFHTWPGERTAAPAPRLVAAG